VVVAVAPVGVMEVTVDEVVDVVAVGDRGVAAALAVDVVGAVARAVVVGGAGRGVLCVGLDAALVDVALVAVVEVAAVDVVDVADVADRHVAAARPVDVVVVEVGVVGHGRAPGPLWFRAAV
jgi:hypothetical protein